MPHTETHEARLALRVVTLLHQQHLSVYKLAKLAALPLSTVQDVCKGTSKYPSVWTIQAIANVLNVSLDYLVGDTDTPTRR